jgi:acyl-CoA synthetase (AMP-forming)/AMP-acid ligase II
MKPEEVQAAVFGRGGAYEIVVEEVLGSKLPVFKNRMRSLRELIDVAAARYEDDEHLVFADRRVSFREHREIARACAAGLRERYGIEKGDRVAILGANSPDWLQAFWGTTLAGGISAALNGWWTGAEIEYGLGLVKPKLLIGDRRRLSRIEGDPGVPVLEIESEFEEFIASYQGASEPDVVFEEDDPALILFTSGTTGFPKGAVLSHRCCVGFTDIPESSTAVQLATFGVDPSQVPRQNILVTAPMFHVSGVLAIGVLAMVQGAKCVMRPGAFDPEAALQLIQDEKITMWAALGASGPRVARHPRLREYDTSSMTRVGFGGAPTSPAIQNLMREAFPNAAQAIGTAYGLSESTAMGTMIGGPDYAAHPESVGRPAPTVEVEIRDEEDRPVGDGTKGEVHIRSAYVMLEYWDNPEATARTIKADRWLATGDVGHFEDGRLYIHSRDRDLILRSAENVYPAEIENRLEDHDLVAEAAVIGVDHPEHGQEVKAVVVPVPGSEIDVPALEAWCRETLAAFKVPTVWELRRELLPRNASGKVLKTVLKGETEEREPGD